MIFSLFQDTDIDYKESLKIVNAVTSNDVRLIYVKGSKHELVEDHGLQCILFHLKELLSS